MSRSTKGSALLALATAGLLALAPTSAPAKNAGLEAYKINLKAGQLQELAKAGLRRHRGPRRRHDRGRRDELRRRAKLAGKGMERQP